MRSSRARWGWLSICVLGGALMASSAQAGEPSKLVYVDECDPLTVDKAKYTDKGKWSYVFAGRCRARYHKQVTRKESRRSVLAVGPRPSGPLAQGDLIITGSGIWYPGKREAHEKVRIEGLIKGRRTHLRIDTKSTAKFRCFSDPFLKEGDHHCTPLAVETRPSGAPQLISVINAREAPLAQKAITTARRNQIKKKSTGVPPPPPPPKKKDPKLEALKKAGRLKNNRRRRKARDRRPVKRGPAQPRPDND